jgi:hypothetical protein
MVLEGRIEAGETMMTVQYELNFGDVRLKTNTLNAIGKFFDDKHEEFSKKVIIVHKKSVFEILTRLIRMTPVDTGRLRGSWTTFMDKYGQIFRYSKFMRLPSMFGMQKKNPNEIHFSEEAVNEGKSLGFYIDDMLQTTIGTNVNYAGEVDARYGYFADAVVWGNDRYNKNFEGFIADSAKKGIIPPVTLNDEGSVI